MRPAWLLLGLLLAPTVQAVDFTDEAGDSNVQGAPVPGLDLRGGSVLLDSHNLTLSIQIDDVAAAQRGTLSPLAAWEFWLEARYRGETFHFVVDTALGEVPDPQAGPVDTTTAGIYRQGPDEAYVKLHAGVGDADAATNTYSASFPADRIEASDGFVLGPGELLELVAVVAYFDEGPGSPHDFPRGNAIIPQQVLQGGDRADLPPNSYLMLPGTATGLALSTPRPVRFSNGEATTYHWPVSLSNQLDRPLDVAIDVATSDDLDVRAPAGVRLAAGESRTVAVYATVPFQHQHGGQRDLTFTATASGVQATLPLAIHYLEVPQPAGHHPRTFIHATNSGGGSSGSVWMDTLQEPLRPVDAQMHLRPMSCRTGGDTDVQPSAGLWAPLDPVRQLGLDADLEQPARFTGRLVIPGVQPSGQLLMKLMTYDPVTEARGPGFLATDDPGTVASPVQLTADGAIELELDLPVPAELDYLAPTDPRNVALVLVLCGDSASTAVLPMDGVVPYLEHGASLAWPLAEYHDAIELDSTTGPRLSVAEARRAAPPASTVTWSVAVEGPAAAYGLSVFGVHADGVSLSATEVPAGGEVRVSLAVPAEARDGDVLEFVLGAQDRADPLAASALRLSVVVDPAAPAQASASPEANAAPAAGWLAAAALVAVALRRRPGAGP